MAAPLPALARLSVTNCFDSQKRKKKEKKAIFSNFSAFYKKWPTGNHDHNIVVNVVAVACAVAFTVAFRRPPSPSVVSAPDVECGIGFHLCASRFFVWWLLQLTPTPIDHDRQKVCFSKNLVFNCYTSNCASLI